MKNKTKSIISTILAAVLAASVIAFTVAALAGCSSLEGDSAYITYSNGGSVVEHGDYIYFINGVGGFPTTDIKEDVNVAGEVEKSGLYRVKKHGAILNDWDVGLSTDVRADYLKHEAIDFESTEMDWFDLRNYTIDDYHEWSEEKGRSIPHYEKTSDITEYHVTGPTKRNPEGNVELVAGKIIGTNNYTGGIFIFDERIYFASPANTLDKEGNYQYNKVDFFTCSLDGKNLTKLYTTTGTTEKAAINASDETADDEKAEAETVSIPYNFTKQNGKVYLTTYEQWYDTDADEAAGKMTGFLVTVEITNGIAGRTTIVARNVLGAYFPVRETYVPGSSTNTIYDFVYFVRIAEKDVNRYGTVIEMMRPNGDDREIVVNNNKRTTVEGISGDFFYYRNNSDTATSLEYSNLRTQLENSSYVKVKDSNGNMVPKTVNGEKVKKSGGKTFLDEQEALAAGYSEWLAGSNRNPGDEKFVAYESGYILPMTNTSHVIIENLNKVNNQSISGVFLVPQKSSTDISNVYVVATGSNYTYNIGVESGVRAISPTTFTCLVTYGGKIYGFDSNNLFGYMEISPAYAKLPVTLSSSMPYTTVSNNTYLMMDVVPVHDSKGNLVDVYAAYFTNYTGEKATNYMAMMKIEGKYSGEGYGPTPVGYVLPSERKDIICKDPDCIDYTHNHTERDGFDPGVDPNAKEDGSDQMSFG